MKNKRLTTYVEFEDFISQIENQFEFKMRLNEYNKENGTNCKTLADLILSSMFPVHKFADVEDVMKTIDRLEKKGKE